MRRTIAHVVLVLSIHFRLAGQQNWLKPSLLDQPNVRTAMQSVDERRVHIVNEWIRLAATPAPSGKEGARADYIRAQMKEVGLTEIRIDDMLNVSGVHRGTGTGPTVVFAAHMDTVFPDGTDVTVKRNGDTLRGPGVADDTSNLIATLEMFRALQRAGVRTGGDLVFLASAREELGALGAKHWLHNSGYKPDMFVAVDLPSTEVWYGALRIEQFKFFYTAPGAHNA